MELTSPEFLGLILASATLALTSCSSDAPVGPSPEHDSGTDTNSIETSVPDSSGDTGRPDTSAPDSSPPDAGPPDTVSDAGPTIGPSCTGALMCGTVSCCDATIVSGSTGGTLPMGMSTSGTDKCPSWDTTLCWPGLDSPEHLATVSDFRLDTFEVTVGRFRKFVAAYPSSKPKAGAGAHPKIGAPSGWNASWPLPIDKAALMMSLTCDTTGLQTWTDIAGANEKMAINCVNWYTAFAFCAWDTGRLPTEAEWEYAAAAGSENRLLPWVGTAEPTCTYANFGGCVGAVANVGSTPLGVAKWGQHDLAGNVMEWTLDEFAKYGSVSKCDDCANTSFSSSRVLRGGAFASDATGLRASNRLDSVPGLRLESAGFRCARSL